MKILTIHRASFSSIPLLVLSLVSAGWCANRIERKLVLYQIRDGRGHISNVMVSGDNPGKTDEFKISGYFKKWNCSGWLDKDAEEVVVDCSLPDEIWKIQSTVRCDSKDLFFIDAVNMKCEGKSPVKWALEP